MRGFVSTTVLLLALVSGVSSFVLPAPCARIEQGGLHTGSSAETQTRAGTPRTMASAWTRRVNVDRPSHEATTGRAVLAAAPRGGGEDGGEELEEKAGIEPKYLAAIVVFLLAAAYDLFVTHEGRLWEL